MLAALWMGIACAGIVQAAFKVTTTSMPDGIAGLGYGVTLTANGGPQPYTWSLAAGSLPGGLTITTAGSITGTPSAVTTANFTVQAKDANGSTDTQVLHITINPAVSIVTNSLPDAVVGSPYSNALAASGGTAPFVWSVGLGKLANRPEAGQRRHALWKPEQLGKLSFTVKVTDAKSATDSQALSLVVHPTTGCNHEFVAGRHGDGCVFAGTGGLRWARG